MASVYELPVGEGRSVFLPGRQLRRMDGSGFAPTSKEARFKHWLRFPSGVRIPVRVFVSSSFQIRVKFTRKSKGNQ